MASLRVVNLLHLVDLCNPLYGVSDFPFSHPGERDNMLCLRGAAGLQQASRQQCLFLCTASGGHARVVRDMVACCLYDSFVRTLSTMHFMDTRCRGLLA